MGENADLGNTAQAALLRYRDALARVEAIEFAEERAHQALLEWRQRVEVSISQDESLAVKSELVEAGECAVSQLQEIRLALGAATLELKAAFAALAALDD
jgi:hypothetical protein